MTIMINSEFSAWQRKRMLREIMEAGKESARPDVIDFCKGIIFPMYLAEDSYSMDSDLEFEDYWRNL